MKTRYNILFETFVKKEILTEEEFNILINTDPTTIKTDNEIKVGKYSNWLIKTYLKAYEFVSDFEKDTKEYNYQLEDWKHQFIEDNHMNRYYLSKFDRFKSRITDETKRDIMNIKGFGELLNLEVYATKNGDKVKLSEYVGKLKIKNGGEITITESPWERFKFPGSEILTVSEKYTLVKITDKGELGAKAAAFFGGRQAATKQMWDNENKTGDHSNETSWCTSIENGHHFQSYINSGPLYIILSNDVNQPFGTFTNLPRERYQFHFARNEFRDRLNQGIDLVKELSFGGKFEEFKIALKPEFQKDANNGKFELTYQNNDASIIYHVPNPGALAKYKKIYGEDSIVDSDLNKNIKELIDSLPDDVKILFISNTTEDTISVDIPDLSRFKELESIKVDNCINSFPSTLKENTKLEFLTLVNNKNVFKIPNDLETLNNLLFVSVENSNVTLSEEFKKIFIELDSPGFYINPKNYEEYA